MVLEVCLPRVSPFSLMPSRQLCWSYLGCNFIDLYLHVIKHRSAVLFGHKPADQRIGFFGKRSHLSRVHRVGVMRECCDFNTTILNDVLPPILILEFIFGLLGNALVLWMFAFHVSAWKTSSVFLAHLAVADTIVLFCLPFRADYYLRKQNWIYGDAMCRILMFLLAANRAAGIFFLTAVAVDRYIKVVHPYNRINQMGLRYVMLVCGGLWIVIIAMTAYLFKSSHLHPGNHMQCESFNICIGQTPESVWHDTLYLLQFFLPAAVIVFCSVCIALQLKSKTVDTGGRIMRAIYFVLTVSLVFIICFLPSTVTRMAMWILRAWYDQCIHFEQANLAFYTSVCLTYFNSVLNPVVYYLSSPAFSGTIWKVWHKILGRPLQEEDRRNPPEPSRSRIFSVTGQV